MKTPNSTTSAPPQDITGKIGPLFRDPESPEIGFYSYSRAAYLFWQGFYEGLLQRGLTHQQAIEEMCSKGTRWMFDHDPDSIMNCGRAMAAGYELLVTKPPRRLARKPVLALKGGSGQ